MGGFPPILPKPCVYESDLPYPEGAIELVKVADLESRTIAHVRISPVQYVPREG